ncbi:MAG: glycosyltransferase family 9 protein [Candidatus Hydrogenedentes bacterium]|nr:glycosyltransferase family 9 protein [Candidatus Hydrogenedentota bacterium]
MSDCERPIRILVAQMTRMGDVLQTSPLIRSLRTRHPDGHIAVMVRRMGKSIAECNPDIDEVLVYEEDTMFQDLKSGDSDRFLHAYETAGAYATTIRDGRYDVIYNCTHSFSSAILFAAAGAPEVIGAHLSDDWRYVIRGRGPNYFFTSILHREYNNLNLCDAFRFFLVDPPASQGLVMNVGEAVREQAHSILREYGIADNDFLVCFQLGASDKDKRWPVQQFARLAGFLKEKYNAKIALLGVSAEAYLGQEFERLAPGVAVPLFGKTSVPQLAEVLRRSRVLVTNDTGTMHIAAAMQCPIVLVSVGYVHFRETGPYGAGHIAIERRRSSVGRSDIRESIRSDEITPEQVLKAVELVVERESSDAIPSIDDTPSFSDVDIYYSGFAPDGCLEWYPVVRRPMQELDFIRMTYRAMWLDFLSERSEVTGESAAFTRMLACFDGDQHEALETWRNGMTEIMQKLVTGSNTGVQTSVSLLNVLRQGESMKRAKALVTELMDLDEQLRLIGEVHRVGRPLVAIARFERDNLEGADPVHLTRTTRGIYEDIHTRATLMIEKAHRIAQLAQGESQNTAST